MAQGKTSTLSGGRVVSPNPAKLQGEGEITPFDQADFDTTTCSGNLVIADGTVGGDERKVAEGAHTKKPGG